jgi:hypothetical protein
MKKIDTILQKAALFEKLASYGDRTSFLRSLAQGIKLTNEMKSKIDSLIQNILAIAPTNKQIPKRLEELFNSNNPDMNELLSLVQRAAKLIPQNTNGPQRAQADQLIKLLGGHTQSELSSKLEELPPDPNSSTQSTLPEMTSTQTYPSAHQYGDTNTKKQTQTQMTAIPADVRQALKQLGYNNPINTAAEGQKALDWFRDKYKLPATGQVLYNEIKQQLKRESTPNVAEF